VGVTINIIEEIESDGERIGSLIHPATDPKDTVLHPTL